MLGPSELSTTTWRLSGMLAIDPPPWGMLEGSPLPTANVVVVEGGLGKDGTECPVGFCHCPAH